MVKFLFLQRLILASEGKEGLHESVVPAWRERLKTEKVEN